MIQFLEHRVPNEVTFEEAKYSVSWVEPRPTFDDLMGGGFNTKIRGFTDYKKAQEFFDSKVPSELPALYLVLDRKSTRQ